MPVTLESLLLRFRVTKVAFISKVVRWLLILLKIKGTTFVSTRNIYLSRRCFFPKQYNQILITPAASLRELTNLINGPPQFSLRRLPVILPVEPRGSGS